ncbi:MAG: pentapeptide repeat-containing protein [Azospirillaceae bacterium]
MRGTSIVAAALACALGGGGPAMAQSGEAALDRLTQTGSCPGCDLTGADLTARHDLSGADLSGAVLDLADLSGMLFSSTSAMGPGEAARFSGASLERAFLHDGWFAGVDFSGSAGVAALFARSTFTDARFEGASLALADFGNVAAAGASFAGADLQGARLDGADLGGANLLGANLALADLSGADLSGAAYAPGALDRAILCRTVLTDGAYAERDCLAPGDYAMDGEAGCDLYRHDRHAGLSAFWTGGCMEGNRADGIGAVRYYRDGELVEAFFGETSEGHWTSGFTARLENGELMLDAAGRFVRNQAVGASHEDAVGIVEAFQNGLDGLRLLVERLKADGNAASARLYEVFADEIASVRPRFD